MLAFPNLEDVGKIKELLIITSATVSFGVHASVVRFSFIYSLFPIFLRNSCVSATHTIFFLFGNL